MKNKNLLNLSTDPESFLSGITIAVFVNILLWSVALTLWVLFQDSLSNIVGTSFFIIIFLNAHMLAKALYLSVFKKIINKPIPRSVKGEVAAYSILTVAFSTIASIKFELFPVSSESLAPVLFSVLCFTSAFGSPVLNQFKAKRMGLVDTDEQSPFYVIDTSPLKNWQIYIVNIAFIIIPLFLSLIFLTLFLSFK